MDKEAETIIHSLRADVERLNNHVNQWKLLALTRGQEINRLATRVHRLRKKHTLSSAVFKRAIYDMANDVRISSGIANSAQVARDRALHEQDRCRRKVDEVLAEYHEAINETSYAGTRQDWKDRAYRAEGEIEELKKRIKDLDVIIGHI